MSNSPGSVDPAVLFVKHLSKFTVPVKPSSDDFGVYAVPVVSRQQLAEVEKRIKDGASVFGCCKFLSKFLFDPAVVNAVTTRQLVGNADLYLFANTIAWIGHEEFLQADYFVLLIEAVVSLEEDFVKSGSVCLRLLCAYVDEKALVRIPSSVVSNVRTFLCGLEYVEVNYVMSVLMNFLHNAKKAGNSELYRESIRCLSKTILENEDVLIDYDFSEILEEINELIVNVDIDGMELLGAVADVEGTCVLLTETWRKLAIYVTEKMDKMRKTELVVEHETPKIAMPTELTDWQLSAHTFRLFPSKREPLPNDRFESRIQATDILTDDQFHIMSACQVLVHRKFREPIDIFLETYSEHLTSVENHYCFVSMLENLASYTLPVESINNLLESGVFSPKYTVFYEENFSMLGVLRNKIIGLLLAKYQKQLALLTDNSRDSILYIENLCRTHNLAGDISQMISIVTVVDIARLLQIIIFTLSVNFTKELYVVWSTLFSYSVSMAENPEVNNIFFSSIEFTSTLLQHFWHQPLRNLMFSLLRTYIMQPNAMVGGIAKFCEAIFHSALFKEDEQYHSITVELINHLEDAMNHRQDIVQELSIITPSIVAFLLRFPTRELLTSTLNFLTLVSFNSGGISFSHKEMLRLGETIRSTEKDGLSDHTKNLLTALIAGTKNRLTSFNIRNPSFILLFLNASSDDISSLIEMFYELCKFSIYNCIQCHKSEIDMVLIQLLYAYPSPFKFRDCVFHCSFTKDEIQEIVIPFLSLIFTYSCSPQTVERFLGLAVPVVGGKKLALEGSWDHRRQSDNDQVEAMLLARSTSIADMIDEDPKSRVDDVDSCEPANGSFKMQDRNCSFGEYAELALDTATTFLSNPHVIKFTYTAKARPLIFSGISLSEIESRFCFSCYILIDQQSTTMDRAILFQMMDSQGGKVILYTTGKSVICETHADQISSASLTTFLQSCQWTMITISIVNNGDGSAQLWFSLNKDPAVMSAVRQPVFVDQNLKVQIGGFMEESKSDRVFCFLGPFRMFSEHLRDPDVCRLYGCGIKGDATFRNLLNEDCECPGSYIESFGRVFRKYQTAISLIPVFSLMNVAPPFFIEKIVDMLKFAQCDEYFNLISQYLLKCESRFLTYSLYLRFFALFTECLSLELLKHILLNFEIWYSCGDPAHVKRIVSHWSQILFTDFSIYVCKSTTFGELLAKTRIFFWFSKDETELIETKRSEDIDIVGIRNVLNRLFIQFAAVELSESDVKCLISHILTTHDIAQKMSFLSLLTGIADLVPTSADCVSQLHPLFNTSNVELFTLTLKTLLTLTKREDVSAQVELVQAHMIRIHYTKDIFQSVLSLCESYPELFTLVCRLAVNCGVEMEDLVREKLCALVDNGGAEWLIKVKSWYIWPVIILLRTPSEKQEQMANAVANLMMIDKRYIDDVLGFIDLIGIKHHIKTTPIIFRIIKFLCNDLTSESKNRSKTIYRCSRYLLFRFSEDRLSGMLSEAFQASPYYSGEPVCSYASELEVHDLSDVCSILEVGPTPLLFGVPFDAECLPIFDEVVNTVASYVAKHEVDDAALKKYTKFFRYLSTKSRLSDETKFRKLHKLSTGLTNEIKVMEISFNGSFLKGMKAELLKYIKTVCDNASNLISSVEEELVQCALDSLESIGSKRLICRAKARNSYNFFSTQYMNRASIWRCFPGKLPGLKKSFKLLDNYTCPGYRVQYNVYRIEVDPMVVTGSPVFLRQAKLERLNSTHSIKFAILADKIIFSWATKIVILQAKDVKLVLYRPPTSYEIVTFTGKTYLIAFQSNPTSDLMSALKTCDFNTVPLIQNSISHIFVQRLNLTMEWLKGGLNNFDYIMRLNYFGGRTFNCAAKYPIFPLLRYPDGTVRELDKKLEINPNIWLQLFVGFSLTREQDDDSVGVQTVTFDAGEGQTYQEVVESASLVEEETKTIDESQRGTFAQVYDQGTLELTPEFFCCPEAFTKLVKPSEYKFVVEMRRLLESDEVTSKLHLWIDNVFGCKSSNETILFRTPHPAKTPSVSQPAFAQRHYFGIVVGNTTYASLDLQGDGTVQFHAITNDSQASIGLIAWDKDRNVSVKVLHKKDVVIRHSVISAIPRHFLLIDSANSEVQIIGQDVCKTIPMTLYPTDSCGDSGVCYSEHGVVYCIEKTSKHITVFGVCKVSPESPLCACTSVRHNITAVGVRSGRILLYERRTGHYLREIACTGDTPKQIAICTTFPFVVVEYANSLKLYSIYGALLNEIPISFDISLMSISQSRSGFDHIFITDMTGRILHIEAVTLQVTELMKFGSRILAMRYIPETSILLAFTQEGRGLCIPLVL